MEPEQWDNSLDHGAIQVRVVRKGENKIIFKVDGGGTVVIRNIVFFFHRDVD